MKNVKLTEENRNQLEYIFYRRISSPEMMLDLDSLQKRIRLMLRYELTPTQRKYMELYYWNKMTMENIAKKYGVNKATVSRTLKRARTRLSKYLKYADPKLLR